MSHTVVTATTGRELGTAPSRRLRDTGTLPGVVYGLDKEPVNISVDYHELREALKTEAGLNTILTLDVDGDQDAVIVREIQRDPIKRLVAHVDFMRVEMETPIKVTVPIRLAGRPTAVLDAGALVEQKLFTLKVSAKPSAIPAAIDADISELTIESRLQIKDVVLPDGVSTRVDPGITVASPVATRASRQAANEAAKTAGDS